MSKINDGGHAFPVTFEGGSNSGESPYFHEGMSLRQYYAGKALQGMLASEPDAFAYQTDMAAYRAVSYADALIAELEKGGDA